MVRDGAVGAGNGRRVPTSVREAALQETAEETAEEAAETAGATEPPSRAAEPA
jgi:hypothetical protein